MVNYNKLMEKLKEKGITTYTIRQKALIPQGTLAKLKMCSGATMEEIMRQLLQCQPEDLIEWKVDLKPELEYETRFKNEKQEVVL